MNDNHLKINPAESSLFDRKILRHLCKTRSKTLLLDGRGVCAVSSGTILSGPVQVKVEIQQNKLNSQSLHKATHAGLRALDDHSQQLRV